jgi:hypothetical protein
VRAGYCVLFGCDWVNIPEAGCMKSVGLCRKCIKLAENMCMGHT